MNREARIMLVDDEQSVLNALQRFFRRNGYQVTTCTSGHDALEILEKSEPYNLVISDYRMPGISGLDFLRIVRARWPDTVRIVLSGFADSDAIISATNEGNIYKFISKPWDEVFLLRSIEEALELNASNLRRVTQSRMLDEALSHLGSIQSDGLVSQSQILSAYHTLLDQMPVGLIGVDSKGEIVSMNERACNMLGLSLAPLGEMFYQALPAFLDMASDSRGSKIKNNTLSINGRQIQVLLKNLKDEGMEGIILILVLLERSDLNGRDSG